MYVSRIRLCSSCRTVPGNLGCKGQVGAMGLDTVLLMAGALVRQSRGRLVRRITSKGAFPYSTCWCCGWRVWCVGRVLHTSAVLRRGQLSVLVC